MLTMTKTLEKEFHALFRPPPASTERLEDDTDIFFVDD